jgi:tetratricopeptide (TPR) repeat protein
MSVVEQMLSLVDFTNSNSRISLATTLPDFCPENLPVCESNIKQGLYRAIMNKVEDEIKSSQIIANAISLKMTVGILNYNFPIFHFNKNSRGSISPCNMVRDDSNMSDYYSKAQQLFLECYDTRRESVGKTHPDTLTSLYWLAKMHVCQQRYDVAKRYFTKCFYHRNEVQGEFHASTIEVLVELTEVLNALEEYAQAKGAAELTLFRIHTSCQDEDGPADDDLRLLRVMISLAIACTHIGQIARAKLLFLQCLARSMNIRGEHHVDTLSCMHEYAVLLVQDNNYPLAEELFQKCLEGRKQVLGETAIPTLTTLNELTDLYIKQGQQMKAES